MSNWLPVAQHLQETGTFGLRPPGQPQMGSGDFSVSMTLPLPNKSNFGELMVCMRASLLRGESEPSQGQ